MVPANSQQQAHEQYEKNILKISSLTILIILIITSIILLTKNNRTHIQIELESREIVFSDDVEVIQNPYFLNFSSDNIKKFLEKNNIKDADKIIIYNGNHIIYQGYKSYLRSLKDSQQWGLPGRVFKDGKIQADMFAISSYYQGHIFREPYSRQYFLEMSCVNENDPFPMYGENQ